jgi:hypothetical protein
MAWSVGLRKLVSLCNRIVKRRMGVEKVVSLSRMEERGERWAKHSWDVPFMAKEHQMTDTIMQVNGEEESSRTEIRTFIT